MTSPSGRSRSHRIPLLDRVFRFIETRTPIDRLILKISLLAFFISLAFVLFTINKHYLIDVPHTGGTLTEAIVGTPRFVNPLLAVTPADKDVAALVYAGLMKLGPEGVLIPDMAESITVSDDGLTYSVVLRSGLTFHDGSPVTADDIIFTIARIQDPALKSPLLSSWEGISTERVSDRELNIVLAKPYGPFIENLSVGILPKHIWEEASADAFPFSQYNSEPIGSGPYTIARIVRSKSGIPEAYELTPFAGAAGGAPRIETLRLAFYANEDALIDDWRKGLIDSVARLSPEGISKLGDVRTTHVVLESPLPRTFAVFMNQNEAPVFRDSAVRAALALVTDRAAIVNDILAGNGYPLSGPIPPRTAADAEVHAPLGEADIDRAREILREDGWKFDDTRERWVKRLNDVDTELAFTLSTANAPALERTAEALAAAWARIGVVVEIEKYEQVDLTQSVIRPRKFQALLFGTVIGRELDFYPFWHSSQRIDPGLNVALYANIATDDILTHAREASSPEERARMNAEFSAELAKDTPAIFLYAPSFTYILPISVRDAQVAGIAEPYERFASIPAWYIDTESVWPIFK